MTYECVVDSALSLEELQHTRTGLYVAIFGSDTDFIETSSCPKTEHGRNNFLPFQLHTNTFRKGCVPKENADFKPKVGYT